MSISAKTERVAEFAHAPERQPESVIAAADDAVHAARDSRDDAQSNYDSWAHSIARCALDGRPVPPAYAAEYMAAEKARDAARAALQAARVTWYHSMGKHAHSFNPDLCCGVAGAGE